MRKLTFVIALMILISVFIMSAYAEDTWDCPECGKKGNTGNFCGNCAYPSPAPTPPPTPIPTENLSGKPMLFSKSAKKVIPALVSICKDAKGWTEKAAPKKVKNLKLLPDHWTDIAKWIKNLQFTLTKNGDQYEFRMNQKDTYQLLTNLDCTVYFENERGASTGVDAVKTADGVYSLPASEAKKAQEEVHYTKDDRFEVWFGSIRSRDHYTRDWREDIIIQCRNHAPGMESYEYGSSINYYLMAESYVVLWNYYGHGDYSMAFGIENNNTYNFFTTLIYNADTGKLTDVIH